MKIKNMKFLILFFFLFLLSSRSFPFEKVGTTSFQFLKVMTSARGTALGGAFTTLVNNSEAVFWNPAGLTRVSGFDASFSFVDYFMDVVHYSFSAAYTVDGLGTFGFQGLLTDVGDIEVTTVSALGFVGNKYNPGLTGEIISPSSTVLGISFAKNLTDKFSFGLTAKYVSENLVYEKADALVFDGGLIFNTGFRSVVIGASLRHFGPQVIFIDKKYPLPQTFNISISGKLFSAGDALISSLENHSLLIAYDMIQPRDFDQQHAIGMEYSFNNMVYLRGGYKFNSDQESISAGIGIKYNDYRVDYSYDEFGDYLDSVHRVTVGLEIN